MSDRKVGRYTFQVLYKQWYPELEPELLLTREMFPQTSEPVVFQAEY
jgi:hypothetical protein